MYQIVKSRSPHGERGLKFVGARHHEQDTVSLPARGAWVEITSRATRGGRSVVAPRTGSVG